MTTKLRLCFLKHRRIEQLQNYVLTYNRFNTYMVFTFNDLNEAQIYKMPYRDGPHHDIETLVSFIHLNFL